jgi:hypothetical protein
MASTRDKRLKTDSPTPVATNETAATTPTSKASSTAIKLKRMSRNRSGILSVKSENEDGNDSVGLSEDTQSSTASAEAPKTPNTRTKRQPVKDGKEEEESANDTKDKEESPVGKESENKKLTKAQSMKQKGSLLTAGRRQAIMNKRNSLPLPVKSSLRNTSLRLSSGAKIETTKEEIQATPKKGKPGRKPAAEKKAEEAPEQEEESEVTADTIDDTESVTEKSEIQEKLDDINDAEAVPEVTIKQEKFDKSAAALAIELLNVRRSTRQRKSTIKDRDSPFTGRKSQVREKSESKRDSISPALSTASIKAEKESSKEITITVSEPLVTAAEKDPSLSPELVSEEMDTESVQHLYDKPDFLENNLGIEQDPKLGEIVKVQEKTKVVESVIKSDEETVDEVAADEEAEIVASEDVEMKEVEEEEQKEIVEDVKEEKEKVNGEKIEAEPLKDAIDEVEVELKPKQEKVEPEPKVEKEPSVKDEESGEENKENNVESSAKSVGSNSPRSEDSLKIVSEENVPKTDLNPADIEMLKQKESHLLSLGLLTHKAAGEAKIAKQKRKEELAKSIAAQPAQGGRKKKEASGEQYTGTLKTIIKLNRTEKEKRKTRMPLKMTFQKKNRDRDSNGSSNSSDSFYTIQEVSFTTFLSFSEHLLINFSRFFLSQKDAASALDSQTGAISRKSHNRSYNHGVCSINQSLFLTILITVFRSIIDTY